MQDFKIKEERKNGRRFGGGFSTELANLASEKWTVRSSAHMDQHLNNPPTVSIRTANDRRGAFTLRATGKGIEAYGEPQQRSVHQPGRCVFDH